ncbi:MAG: CAP domain-containing protein [Myxococcota bacterium]
MSLAIWAVAPLAACDTPGGGRSSVATDAAATTPTTTTRDASTSSGDANGDGLAVCARWKADRADLDEGSWTGSTQSCDAGALLEPGHGHALAQVNLYRFLAGLPPVAEDATKSEAAQACALLMHANNDIQHVVPTSWHCFDQIGASAAGLSNLATTPAVSSIDLYITDEDIPTLGHRRWVLSNSLGPIGIGSTSRFSCLHVIGGDGRANARWTAWPPPGDVPYEALEHGRGESTDAAGWSVQSDAIDLRGANVTVTRDGTELDVQVRELASGYGSTFGLGIDPVGWQTEPGATYHVAVRGLSEDLDWDVHVVSCQ